MTDACVEQLKKGRIISSTHRVCSHHLDYGHEEDLGAETHPCIITGCSNLVRGYLKVCLDCAEALKRCQICNAGLRWD